MAKILLVEDNPLNLELETDLLEMHHHQVLAAETAEIGIAMARSERPDLILMDISLPGLDGLEATRILRRDEQTRAIPIVAVTAHAMRGDAEKVAEAGCQGYLTKPIDTRTFVAQVESFLPGGSQNAAE